MKKVYPPAGKLRAGRIRMALRRSENRSTEPAARGQLDVGGRIADHHANRFSLTRNPGSFSSHQARLEACSESRGPGFAGLTLTL